MKKSSLAILFLVVSIVAFSQLQRINVGSKQSFRGLSVLNDDVVWLSGTNGTYLFTLNEGKTWEVDSIAEAKGLDFRDVDVVNDSTAYLLTAGSPALLYKTTNNGKKWELLFKDERPETFLDGMDFWNDTTGVIYGDPIAGELACYSVLGKWVNRETCKRTLEGEAGFAASGSGIVTINDSLLWIATGGGEFARVIYSTDGGKTKNVSNTPLVSGEGMGIFSMTFWNAKEGVVVGGSYIDSTNAKGNCAITKDGGVTWQLIDVNQPNGYRSCVASNADGSLLVACGRTGIDYSLDKGITWKSFSMEGYYSVAIAYKVVWFSGRKGKVAKANVSDFN